MKFNLAILLSAFLLTGCAGLATPFINNPYAGNYDGTWSSTTGDEGSCSIQLTKLGNIFGTLKDATDAKTGSLTGSVDSNLHFSGTISFPGVPDYSVSGTLKSDHNLITGTLSGKTYTDTFNLTKE